MLLDLLRGNFELIPFLRDFLVNLPAFVIALTLHEAAHAYVALRCGDPTAKLMGRLTLNPLRHLDPKGFLFMFIAGVGWAKPVPVDPRNFRNPRRDDFLVSVAGILANLLLFLLSTCVLYGFVTAAMNGRGYGEYWLRFGYQYAFGLTEDLIVPELGQAAGLFHRFFVNLAIVNISLALFNLLPVPPLDGYHVFNHLILRNKNLFASSRMRQLGSLLILALVVSGVFSKIFNVVVMGAFRGLGSLAFLVARALGVT